MLWIVLEEQRGQVIARSSQRGWGTARGGLAGNGTPARSHYFNFGFHGANSLNGNHKGVGGRDTWELRKKRHPRS